MIMKVFIYNIFIAQIRGLPREAGRGRDRWAARRGVVQQSRNTINLNSSARIPEINLIIDFSSHIIPPAADEIFKHSWKHAEGQDDPEFRLKIMDRYGIGMQVVHLSAAHLYGLDARGAERACRISNDYVAKIVSMHPDRFAGCGILSILDVGSALDELDRVVKDLGFRCITIGTHQRDIGLDSEELHRLYGRIASYNVPVFLHPVNWDGYPLASEGNGVHAMSTFGWPFDTSLAIWRMIAGGIFDKFPGLRIITHHLGGMLPFYRMRAEFRFNRYYGGGSRRTFMDYLKRVYADTAVDGGSVADLMTAYQLFGPKRIVFGSDWPYIDDAMSIGDNLAAIRSAPLPDEEKEMILHGNAEELLGFQPRD